jgi:exonuclease VII large subunit
MAVRHEDEEYLLDLAAILKALRAASQEAADVGEGLRQHLQAVQGLDTRLATAVTQAVTQAQAQVTAALTAEAQRQQAALSQQGRLLWEGAERLRRGLTWRVSAVLLAGLLGVNGGWLLWWGSQQAAERRTQQRYERLVGGLDHYLRETLYPKLTPAQQRELDALYQQAEFAPLGKPRP